MLTKEEFHQSFRIISLGCRVGILPLEVDVENGKLKLLDSKWKKGICWVYFALYLLHVVDIALRFPYVVATQQETPLMYLLWHCSLFIALPIFAFCQYTAVFCWPGITVTCFNTAFEMWECERAENKRAATKLPSGLWASIRKLTPQELLAIAYPYCLGVSAVAVVTLYCLENDMTALLYASLPERMKNPWWFALLLMQEANMYLYVIMNASLIFQLHILFPGKLNTVLGRLAASHKPAHHWALRVEQAKKTILVIRCIQFLVSIFNTGHRNIVCVIKMNCITVATINGYAALTYGSKNPVFGCMALCVFCDLIFLYAFVYEKAFAIPEGLDKVKVNLRMRMRLCRTERIAKMVNMQLRSIPAIGIKVGDFHTLERISTPVFVDYVVHNIMSLLVTL